MKRFGPSVVGGPWRVAGKGASRIGFQIRMVKRRWADDWGVEILGNFKVHRRESRKRKR